MNTEKCPSSSGLFFIVALFILAAGIGFAGLTIQKGLKEFRSYDRYVTVKGLATRDVMADLAVWPISHTVTGDDLTAAQQALEEGSTKIVAFLKNYNLDGDAVEKQQIQMTDQLAQSYRNGPINGNRFILTQTLIVRSENIEDISNAAQNIGDLARQKIILSQNSGPTYLFTQLNDIKPQMIAEATRNARDAADQFAKDSGQKVGDIRNAYQGMFQILPRDQTYTVPESAQKNKTVRVVSTIDFYLE